MLESLLGIAPLSQSLYAVVVGTVGIALLIGSYTDLRTREVPDMLNYGLVMLGMGVNVLLSIHLSDARFISASMLGALACFLIGCAMFYGGQWGGGDSKMLIGIGAFFGLPIALSSSLLLAYLVNILLAGAIYGLFWSMVLCIRNWESFMMSCKKLLAKKKNEKRVVVAITALLVIAAIGVRGIAPDVGLGLSLIGLFVALSCMLWLFSKGIEQSCLLIKTKPAQLTEGDWIARDVLIDGKRICGPKDLGISREQIRKLKAYYQRGKIREVVVKIGIPFIPSFFLALVLTVVWGNPLLYIIYL